MKAREHVQDLLNFIDVSPSPWHAVATSEQRLQQYGFKRLYEADKWRLSAGERYYVVRDDSSLVAFVIGRKSLPETGFKIFGAHTDSPGLRVKPNAAVLVDGVVRLGVEVYGGPILATFSDRDLSLAGRFSYKADDGVIVSRLLRFDQALLRLPNLAIHMNRNVNSEGLKFDKQNELPLLLTTFAEEQLPPDYFYRLLEQAATVKKEQILSWELNVYDTQKGVFWGPEQEFYANGQLDNLASCHAGLSALLDEQVLRSGNTLVCAFFDHEEIGSESHKGADGSFLPDILERMALSIDVDREGYRRSLAQSYMISADMAHAYQPNFPNAYEPDHKVMVNNGPVIKVNANLRYTSESLSEAMFVDWCKQAGVNWQHYAHRTDIACGSTIGPMASARLGIRSIDVGNPMWAMHSARESAGVQDHHDLIRVLACFFTG
ncbi:M18 family aminopeptidase [Methylomarinum sp. Ch1-1]|uniref:M18 family aminopeptidase n=1 Tax=Methylomarinum roseum TaxID=3067653 RepID=A0AAU7NXI2_9GAMM|nr:M18 family aminopeptidase [Methylomarinum sp. Ch1-1]MDP4522282.1 M18 family aminopeptidase [Methylomarinum sp. Ch1-1]